MFEKFPIYMTLFKQERQIRVYLPKNYNNENRNYPVLYMHDGQNVFNDQEAIGGNSLKLEDYLDEHESKVIVVGIDQNSEERVNEYCPWVRGDYSKNIFGRESVLGGKGKEFVDFIVNELKPFIDNKYRTIKDQSAMAGISLGGLISIYAMCRYPEVFRSIAVFSSAFYWNQEEIEKLIETSDLSMINSVYLDCGTKEAGDDERINREFLSSNKVVYELLKEKLPSAKFVEIQDAEHNYLTFRERVPKLLPFLTTSFLPHP
ncbi:alpha/beta hydrolase [Ureibacillus manganicus]|uniref:Esterase n=1 Tax=Ureibacillus manganicus DSM 26584 TaxID=1384049 RepID=A0A0A3HZW3_9BACL|nr:alpha/beta hydrolase-fold protein [Ureibacillus manganicus]KGR77999.1 esterase [Ureibacillus manganicus DSM 26584]